MVGNAVVLILVIGTIWVLIKQCQHTVNILMNKASFTNRTLLFNFSCSVSLVGFLVSYILNLLIYLQIIGTGFFTSNNTGNSCTVFIVVALITKAFVIKGSVQKKSLN